MLDNSKYHKILINFKAEDNNSFPLAKIQDPVVAQVRANNNSSNSANQMDSKSNNNMEVKAIKLQIEPQILSNKTNSRSLNSIQI